MAKTRTSARSDFFDAATEAAVSVKEAVKTKAVKAPEPEEEKDEATAPIRVFLTPVTRAALKMVSKEQGKTYADIITELVDEAYPEVVAKAKFAAENGLLM